MKLPWRAPVRTLSAIAAATLAVTGCAGNLEVQTAQQRIVENAAPDDVLGAAADLLQREFGRVSIDRAGRRIETDPVEFTADRDSGTARDLLAARSRMRRLAVLSLVPRANGALVRLRVDIEREDAARRSAAREEAYGGDDRPGFTPIDRDAATSERQNTVWTRVRRDRTLERQLLDELTDFFSAENGAPSSPAPAPPAAAAPTGAPPAAGGVTVRPVGDAPPATP